jgi:hypothetical protein
MGVVPAISACAVFGFRGEGRTASPRGPPALSERLDGLFAGIPGSIIQIVVGVIERRRADGFVPRSMLDGFVNAGSLTAWIRLGTRGCVQTDPSGAGWRSQRQCAGGLREP